MPQLGVLVRSRKFGPARRVFGVKVVRPHFHGSSVQLTVAIEITHVPPKTMSGSPHDRKELTEIRKEYLDIYNRIHSIAEDTLFVQRVAEHYCGYPVIRAVYFSYAGPNLNETHSKPKVRSLVRQP